MSVTPITKTQWEYTGNITSIKYYVWKWGIKCGTKIIKLGT